MSKIHFKTTTLLVLLLLTGFLAQTSLWAEAPVKTEDLNIFEWRHVGPWTFSGRITNFDVPPGQSQIYYVATASGGLWKTEDGGISFEPIFEKYGNMSMADVAVAPSNHDIVYAGTGEPMHARSSAHGNGMWKSTDAGKTWKHIGLEESYFITKVDVDPKNADIVFVATEGKLYSNDMDCQRGLYKSTDGGETWQIILDLKDRGVGDFFLDPNNSDIIIASAYKTYRRTWTFIDRQPENHLYKSIDGGQTWKKLTNGLPMDIESGWNGLAIYPKDPNIVYVRMDEEVNLGLNQQKDAALFSGRSLFQDDFYFNKWNPYKINSQIANMTGFAHFQAESEEDLIKKLNEYVNDPDFRQKIGIDLGAFNAKARQVYKKDEKLITSINEIEKIMENEQEYQALYKDINGLVLHLLFASSEGIKITDGTFTVTAIDKVQIHPDLKSQVTFKEDKIKDEKTLAQNANNLVNDPGLLDKLGLNFRTFTMEAKKAYKDNEAVKNKIDEYKDKTEEYELMAGRYQTINRTILQVIYADALAIMEPVKKAGVIYRSEDQGETWKKMTEYQMRGGSATINQIEAGYSGRIYVDPNDDKKLYAVEVRVLISEDSGKTFKFAPWTGRHKCHVDTRGMWIDPLNSNHILNGNDGGVSETWDGGKHWSQKDTIAAQQFYDIAVDDQIPYNVMGGTQDNGCWMGPSRNRNQYGVYPADWTYLPTGDGYYVLRDWWNPEYVYFESQFGRSSRINLKTGEIISLSVRNTDEERAAGKPPQRYQWDSPIHLSPHNPGIVYVCSQHVHMSKTRGDTDTWVTISPDLSKNLKDRIEQSKLTNLQYGTIYTFQESPVKPGVYWAGTDDGNLQLSTDGGDTWQNITYKFWSKDGKPVKNIEGAKIPYDRWVTKVEPSAHDLETCYVTYSGYRTHNEDTSYIFVTHDFGKTWEDLSSGMMNPCRDIEEDPDNPDVLYLATDYGLFVSIDAGKNWVEMSSSAPDVIIMDLDIQKRERDLAIGTYGRGIYLADIYPFKDFEPEVFEKDAYLFDVQRTIKWAMIERRGPTYGEFARVDNPPTETDFYYFLKEKADDLKLVIKDLEGNQIQELTGKKNQGIQKVSWNLRKQAEGGEQPSYRMRFQTVDPGTFTVTLMVNGEEVITKKFTIIQDPILD